MIKQQMEKMWCAGGTLPQCLVESESREVEETQVLLRYHAVEVVTADKRANSSIRGRAWRRSDTPGSLRAVRLAVCNISTRKVWRRGRSLKFKDSRRGGAVSVRKWGNPFIPNSFLSANSWQTDRPKMQIYQMQSTLLAEFKLMYKKHAANRMWIRPRRLASVK